MDTESKESESVELIRNIKDYDPSKLNNAQLADDMRICFAWYSSLRQGKKLKFTKDEVIELARKIYNEIEKRKREGKMKHDWKPEQMKKFSRELFEIISSGTCTLAKIPDGKGQLSIASSPSLAEIWIDNKNTKLLTPEAQIFLDPGSHSVKLKKPHYQDFSFSVSIVEGEKIEKFCELSPKFAVLTLFSVPSHARIFIDGTDQNKVTPETFKFDVSGSSKTLDITLKLPGFKDAEINNLALHPGDKIEKVIHLEPGTSTLSQLETLPIYPGNVSPRFDPLDLDEFLEKWNSFYFRKPFILLVGSLANWQRTEGDIDILVKARDPTPLLNALDRAIIKCFKMNEDQLADLLIQVHQFIHSDSLFLLTRWRIERAFPEWKGRIQVLDDSFSGPFTNFVELADLAAVARSEKVRQEMAQRAIRLFQWFPMLKPMHGRQKGEIYSVDSVIEVLRTRKDNWFDIGVYVQKKYDGTHCQVHKSGKRVLIFTEDGTDVTRNCPTLAKEFQQQPIGSFILCGEIELWKNGKHQPRALTAGILNASKPHPDEKDLIFNVYDCLFFDEVDIHNRPYSKRINYYQKIRETDHIKLAPFTLCHSEQCVREAIKKYSAQEGSEGAYLKRADFPYELDGKTRLNIKYKKEKSLDALVLKRNKVARTEKTYYYHCGLKSDHDIVYCGKTFNTNIKAEPGDIIKVVFVDISGYTDPKTGKRWVNWWAPRVVMLRTDKKEPDTIDTAWRMVKETTGRFEEKPMPDIKNLEQLAEFSTHKDCINFDPESHMCKLHNRLVDPDAPACPDFQPRANLSASAKRFVIQNHFRGSSSHGDFRVQLDHVLGGFTLGWQRADELKRELEKHWQLKKTKDRYEIYWDGELVYALDKRENVLQEPSAALKKRVFEFHKKLAMDPRFWKIDMNTGEELKRKGSVRDEVEKIFCVQKTREPYEWLSVEGVTKPREVEPEPGGTRFFPGIFVEVDSGTYYPGAQKPYFKEYFLDGKKWKGRVVFRLVAGLQGTKAVANWLYWKPDDQTPYVLSARAVRDNWLPSEGSAMPPEWEAKLPEELHFWKASDRKKKLELRKLAREYLIKKEVLSADDEVDFVLTHRYWQGQYVVRGLPVEDYHIKIGKHRFHLDKDPTHKFPEHGISALQFHDKDEYFIEGEKKPQSAVNPNRKIPAYIHVLDRGKAEIIADEPLYLHVRLNGKKLKGLFYFRRTSRDAEFWIFKKGMESF